MLRRVLAASAAVAALLATALPASAQVQTCRDILQAPTPPGAVAALAPGGIVGILDPSAEGFLATRGGTSQTFCLDGVTNRGDVVVTLTYEPATPTLQGVFGDAFFIEVRRFDTGELITTWSPLQSHPGRAVFTLSGPDPEGNGATNGDFRGPFLLRVFNFAPEAVSFRMEAGGPGAELIPGADLRLTAPD